MWRAFFIAVGIILIIVGLECMVVNRYMIAGEARIPEVLAKIMGDDAESPYSQSQGFARGNISPTVAPPQYANQGYGGTQNNSSPYGPSRFSSKYGNNGLFGSRPNGNNPNSQFSLAGYGSRNRTAAGGGPGSARPMRILRTKDWMPWSLIAAGAIIVLYTKSLRGIDFGSDD